MPLNAPSSVLALTRLHGRLYLLSLSALRLGSDKIIGTDRCLLSPPADSLMRPGFRSLSFNAFYLLL